MLEKGKRFPNRVLVPPFGAKYEVSDRVVNDRAKSNSLVGKFFKAPCPKGKIFGESQDYVVVIGFSNNEIQLLRVFQFVKRVQVF